MMNNLTMFHTGAKYVNKIGRLCIAIFLTFIMVFGAMPVIMPSTATVVYANAPSPRFIVIARQPLNLRAGPGTNYRVLRTIPRGTIVNGERSENGFVQITGGGWLSVNYIVGQNSRNQAHFEVRVNAPQSGVLNIRSNPNSSAPISGELLHNWQVSILEQSGEWGRLSNGGWIHLGHTVRVTGTETPPPLSRGTRNFSLARYGRNYRLSNNFVLGEFASRCGADSVTIYMPMIQKLEQIRTHFGNRPVIVNSGFRTVAHNRNVNGVENSLHTRGRAADIQIHGVSPTAIANFARQIGFTEVIVYSSGFVHVGIR